MPRKILKKEAISNPEMLEVLSREEELDALQRRTYEYLMKFSKIPPEKAKWLRAELLKLGDITEEEAAMIVNILPRTAEEIRDIFHYRKTILPEEFINRILELVKAASEGAGE